MCHISFGKGTSPVSLSYTATNVDFFRYSMNSSLFPVQIPCFNYDFRVVLWLQRETRIFLLKFCPEKRPERAPFQGKGSPSRARTWDFHWGVLLKWCPSNPQMESSQSIFSSHFLCSSSLYIQLINFLRCSLDYPRFG